MSNLYHILYKLPVLEKYEMPSDLEDLAVLLINSGKIRIDAFDKVNFARFTIPHKNINLMFSKKELTNNKLLLETKKIISSFFYDIHDNKRLTQKVNEEINRLRQQIFKHQKISNELEIKLARLLVQSAHPVVIQLILLEKVEIYISYSYNIGDMLDIVSWQRSGENSGMQSTNGRDVAIFTSSGGDPFSKTEKDATFGDGFPAIARLMVIVAQEMGHYSDIMRNKYGRQISRHSANFSGTKAKENVRIGRLKDIEIIDKTRATLKKIGLEKLFEYERHLKFYKKNRKFSILILFSNIKIYVYRVLIFYRSRRHNFKFIIFERKEKYLASKIIAMLEDMRFNLAPVADVYKSDDKNEEEAIACIEALARVPQQALKWGNYLTSIFMHNLYNIYYKQVIPACIETYENITGKKYNINTKKRNNSFLFIFFKKFFKKKTNSYQSWNY